MNHPGKPSPYAISLRAILVLSTVIFVIGYQQFQLHKMQRTLTELRQDNEAIRQQMKQQQTRPIRVITTNGQGGLRFPVEVERAMMGDGIRSGGRMSPTPLRVR